MNITDIENLSASDLKSRRDELVEAISSGDAKELASRYVQARTDAKVRDEKLSEQGQTITSLNESLGLHRQEVARLASELEQSKKDHAAEILLRSKDADAHLDEMVANAETIKSLRSQLVTETARADRLKIEATRNQSAVSGAAKLLNDAISAQQIASADAGN